MPSTPTSPEMRMKPEILCYGHDPNLLETRRLLLQRDFRVVVASSLRELGSVAAQITPSLLLICHTAEKLECRQLLELSAALWPHCGVLAIQANDSGELRECLPRLSHVASNPEELTHRVFELLRGANAADANEHSRMDLSL